MTEIDLLAAYKELEHRKEQKRIANRKYKKSKKGLESQKRARKKYYEDYNVEVDPEQILISSGSSLALYIAIRILSPPGSEVIITAPCYACYENMIRLAGAIPVRIPIYLEEGFELNISRIKVSINQLTKA